MALTIDLGGSIFCSLGSNLNLTQHATALIIPPAGISNSKEFRDLEVMLEAGEVWVNQVPEMKLQIRVVVGPDLVGPASTFFTQIGEILCHSKLWQGLDLSVLFKNCDHAFGPDGSETFQLSFGLHKKTKQSKAPTSLRIPTRMRSTHEALPPDGIPVVYLSAINISLDYKRCDQRSIAGPLITENASKNLQHILPMVDIDDEHDGILIEVEYLHHVEYPCASESMVVADKEKVSVSATEPSGLNEEWYSIPPSLPESFSLSPEGQDIQLDREFHALFDIGFRSLITEDQRINNKETVILKSEDSRSLSTILPTTFSIGYREAINQRSQFIPSIASSLASILENSKNPALRHKKSILESSHPQSDSSTTPDTSVVKRSIKQNLWRIAQKQLYNPGASRNLHPLRPSSLDEGYAAQEHSTLFAASATEKANRVDEDDTVNYGSYCLLGLETDEFENLEEKSEQEDKQDEEKDEEDEEKHSLLPIDEDHTNVSIKMFAGASDEDEHMELDETVLDYTGGADQTDAYISPTPASQRYSYNYRPPSSDSEMLSSNSVQEDMDDPSSVPTTVTSIDLGEPSDEDNDYMLCNI